ncbi:MAG: methytransferase partner Trm112 [Dehalococcoidales bacterium]|jgi:uncharacterized protein YbaR (Trm112 family)|nr:methytransferase partner Trm112 [Dehalococcoidales bacterium]
MKQELIDILVCPLCKNQLKLEVNEKDKEEIVNGVLLCRKCDITYPITDTIPNLLPPEQ